MISISDTIWKTCIPEKLYNNVRFWFIFFLYVKIIWPGFISSGSGASLDGRESSRFPTLACGGNEDFSALSGPYPEQHRRKLHYQAKKTMQRSRRVQRTLPLDKKIILAKMGVNLSLMGIERQFWPYGRKGF